MKPAYYNERDAYAAEWLRRLIKAGLIADGDVDERSIEDVTPDDIKDYTQCHFFAGIGGWSAALRRAGWDDSRRIWTASCPCQPFSAAGEGAGFADQRHLWPSLFHLVAERRPGSIIGEQVAAKAADVWVDLVQDDMEAVGYAFGAVAFPSASVGAPHIRDRTYWVGDTIGTGSQGHAGHDGAAGWQGTRGPTSPASISCRVADMQSSGPYGQCVRPGDLQRRPTQRATQNGQFGGLANPDHQRQFAPPLAGVHYPAHYVESRGGASWLANTTGQQCEWRDGIESVTDGWAGSRAGPARHGEAGRPGPTNGYWRDADWLGCRDDKWRPVRPGSFPLAHGVSNRVGRLRAYGNAVNVEQAAHFIGAVYG